MTTRGEELGDTCGLETTLSQTESRSQTCSTSTDNYSVEFMVYDRVSLVLPEILPNISSPSSLLRHLLLLPARSAVQERGRTGASFALLV